MNDPFVDVELALKSICERLDCLEAMGRLVETHDDIMHGVVGACSEKDLTWARRFVALVHANRQERTKIKESFDD